MASLNHVFLIGNLTRDPDVRYMPSGDAVGDLQLAVSRKYKTKDGQERDEVCYIGVVVWGKQAESCKEYLRKGSPVFVEGRLQYEQWEKDGQKRSQIRVRAARIQFLGGSRHQSADSAVRHEDSAGSHPSKYAPAETEASETNLADDLGADDDNLPF